MLIAEELSVLCYDSNSGQHVISRARLQSALAGAVVAELALHERITSTPHSAGPFRRRRVVLLDATLTGDPVLDRALTAIAEHPDQKVGSLIRALSTGRAGAELHRQLVERLKATGAAIADRGRASVQQHARTWFTATARAESAMITGKVGTRAFILVALLHACSALTRVTPAPALGARGLRRRMRSLLDAGPHAEQIPILRAIHTAVSSTASTSDETGDS